MLGHEVEHDASARLINEDETLESIAESHFHDANIDIEEVEVIRFARFITDTVATRRLPLSAQVTTPRVVIKVEKLLDNLENISLYLARFWSDRSVWQSAA